MMTIYQNQQKEPKGEVRMAPARSKLHNMMLPPSLTWGNSRPIWSLNQRGKPIAKIQSIVVDRGRESESASTSTTKYFEKAPSLSPAAVGSGDSGLRSSGGIDGDGGIGAEREKIISDLKCATNEMHLAFMKECSKPAAAAVVVQLDASSSSRLPWNLRSKKVDVCNNKSQDDDEKKERKDEKKQKGKKRFSISLSHSEIEEDFMAIVGRRPPKRPKKRSKIVQNELDDLFPGLGLAQVTAGKYKVSGPRNF
ncbi:uncharacterized protein LOC124923667 [Impatiens glandulifera]|uniref:uncharacterized protein LOC124923667 n=1 Tax=Impatiens glandulifera TaxID=253017 RepID=UPI001FB1251A|nr:uncharacterized protein LOC124923667 [Impatiens glandulifera]